MDDSKKIVTNSTPRDPDLFKVLVAEDDNQIRFLIGERSYSY